MSPTWHCSGCALTIRFEAGADAPAQPTGWTRRGDEWRCLNCRREEVAAAVTGANRAERVAARKKAVTEFELLRDPEAPDGVIAKRARCSAAAVRPVRASLRQSGRLSRR